MAYLGEKYRWKEGTTSGMEQRIESLEARIDTMYTTIAEVQSYVAKQTPFTDVDKNVSCEWCNYYVCQCEDKEDDRGDLIDALKVAHKGLKPGATATQQNIAYYAVRGILSQEED